MKSKVKIFPYNSGSASAKALRDSLGGMLLKREGSAYRGSPEKILINWGATRLPEEMMKSKVINNPDAVAIASNKLKFYGVLRDNEVSVPDFTTDEKEARAWLDEGSSVIARTVLNGSGGEGINYIDSAASWDSVRHGDVKVYCKYVPKKDEYRIHISNGEVVDMQRKALRGDAFRGQNVWKIRNTNNGFVFVREGVEPPECVIEQSKAAVKVVGLDFGAVDVVYNSRRQQAYVLEVNTAPGLEGTTLETYKKVVMSFYDDEAPASPWYEEAIEVEETPVEVQRARPMHRLDDQPAHRGINFEEIFVPAQARRVAIDEGF